MLAVQKDIKNAGMTQKLSACTLRGNSEAIFDFLVYFHKKSQSIDEKLKEYHCIETGE